ncbi:MAG: flagellar protein FlaG [Bacteroidetes bacterium]|nr:flagellar protein FlaG [Bacteroidota bacterium]
MTMPPLSTTFAYSGQPGVYEPLVRFDQKVEDGRTEVSEKEVQRLAQDLDDALRPFNTELSFTVDKESEKMVIKIVDCETQEIVRQIPAEDALRLASRIKHLLGLLVDGNA